jgi:S-adenosyl-L-methionine hydrolase (adenosine-forming)
VAPVVTLLTDFGLADGYPGVCHAVILRICPDARVIHLTHGIEPQRIAQGARALAGTIAYAPVGVHVAVVDPCVGSARRGVAIATRDGRVFVGPDNGLLRPAAEACGGIVAAHALEEPAYMLPSVSRTFHGRDVFAPVAAHVAAGVPLDRLGPAVDPASLVAAELPGHRLVGSFLEAEVDNVDRFGNIRLSVTVVELGDAFHSGRVVEVHAGDDRYYARCAETFADVAVGDIVLYEDSTGALAVGINQGDAARLMTATPGARIAIDLDPGVASSEP